MEELKKLILEIMETVKVMQAKNQGKNDKLQAHIDSLQSQADDLKKQLVNLELGGSGGGSRNTKGNQDQYQKFVALVKGLRGQDIGHIGPREYEGHRNAVGSYLKLGFEGLSGDIRNELSISSDPNGGVWIVPQFDPIPREKLYGLNPMRAVSDHMDIMTGDGFKGLADDEEFMSGWVGEHDLRDETDAGKLMEFEIPLRDQYALCIMTNRLVDFAPLNVLGYVENRLDKRFRRTENKAFIAGTGITQPRGFLDHAGNATTQSDEGQDSRPSDKLQYLPAGGADFPTVSGLTAADDPSALIDLRASLNAELRPGAVWLMNSQTEARLSKMRDETGRFLFIQSLVAGQPNSLLGAPVVIAESMPNIASNSHPIAYGNFEQGFLIVDKPGWRVVRDMVTTKGKTKIFAYKYCGADVVDYRAIKLLRMSES